MRFLMTIRYREEQNQSKDPTNKEDITTVMLYIYHNNQKLDQLMEEMFVGEAMLITAIQYVVA